MLIKNGKIITAAEQFSADLRIGEDGRIAKIAPKLQAEPGEEVMDAAGMLIVPGGIDAHTHFDMPCGAIKTCDDFYTGTRAAVCGGTTTVIDFSEPEQGTDLENGLRRWHEKADGRSFCDYGFHMTVARFDAHLEAEIEDMIAHGVTSFKAYTAYKGDLGVDDRDMYRILELIHKHRGLLLIHCENGDMLDQRREELGAADPKNVANHPLSRPNAVEHDAVSRMLDMARLIGAEVYIVHTSTHEALREIGEAKKEGVGVFCETCPHYLLLTDEKLQMENYPEDGFEAAKYVCSPPLRKKADNEALWNGIREGVVDTVSTDHCAFNYQTQKMLGKDDFRNIPNGLPGVEDRVELMYSEAARNGVSLSRIAQLTAENPAKIFGIYPQKGVIAEGSDADLVLLSGEPHTISVKTRKSAVDYDPYEGMVVDYKVQHVFLRGHQVVRNGEIANETPNGNFLLRKTR